ncbi:MAG: hypothetical protein ACO1OO_17570 [Flavisolibacter sp.]
MKKPFLFLLLFCFSLAASAQKVYFAYFQSDDQSPFYVKLADKVYNSAAAGYLTISNLQDTTYTFHIGFTSNPGAEKEFRVKVNGSDLGLNLKNFPDGPQLFDMQNAVVIAPVNGDAPAETFEARTDPFSKMLAKAAEDPSLLKKPVEVKEQPKPKTETVAAPVEKPAEAVVKAEETGAENTNDISPKKTLTIDSVAVAQVKEPVKTSEPPVETMAEPEKTTAPPAVAGADDNDHAEVVEPDAVFERSQIRRYSETSTTEGFGLVYFDNVHGSSDTIRLLIPNPKVSLVRKTDEKKDEGFFLDLKKEEAAPPTATKDSKEAEVKTETQKNETVDQPVISLPKTVTNTSCSDEATEKDFFKLRRNMAGRLTDEEMIDEARKAFKKMCFSTEYIRYISSLFLTSAGKYQFFDAAFEYTSDKENFASLQAEIKDPYYLNRFKALVGQ